MYLKSGGHGRDHGARYWGRATTTLDRVLLLFGWIALLLVVPALWIWLVYGSDLGGTGVYGGGAALCALTAGIGYGMTKVLDSGR
jgi:hypothetical protein